MISFARVIDPGMHTSVQDKGRRGYRQFGVPGSGILDRFAGRIAGLLVGNHQNEAVLELTVTGGRYEILADADIAVTGAPMPITINNRPRANWSSFPVAKNDILDIGRAESQCRAYLAVSGGIDVPEIMGSRSTYVGAKIGGFNGRPLKTGDLVSRGDANPRTSLFFFPEVWIPRHDHPIILRAVPGPQDEIFGDNIQRLFESEYTVSPQSNRAGYRLTGPVIEFLPGKPKSIISEPCLPGGIQIPADGRPIILLNEQTVGGYAKIAGVISPDIDHLAQALPGDTVRFEKVDIGEAHTLYREYMESLSLLSQKIVPCKSIDSPILFDPASYLVTKDPLVFSKNLQRYLIQI